jgi:hypothetical protein
MAVSRVEECLGGMKPVQTRALAEAREHLVLRYYLKGMGSRF